MNDDKVSVREALDKLYDLSWMVGSSAVEYLTDKDGEKIREYIGVIEDRIYNLNMKLSCFKEAFGDPFKPYDIDGGQAIARGLRAGVGVIDQVGLAEDDPMNFSVGKIVHDLMAKELTEDIKKQILEEETENE